MKSRDQGSSLFWFIFSAIVFIESLRLGIGTLQSPGIGFISFGASGLLGILSLFLFLRASRSKGEVESEPLFSGRLWKRVLAAFVALPLYARLMPILGYLITTFLLMGFLFWLLERKKLWWVLVLSFLTTMTTYYVFSKWLNSQFPDGLFGL